MLKIEGLIPQSRNEKYLRAILSRDKLNLPDPQSRIEYYLKEIALKEWINADGLENTLNELKYNLDSLSSSSGNFFNKDKTTNEGIDSSGNIISSSTNILTDFIEVSSKDFINMKYGNSNPQVAIPTSRLIIFNSDKEKIGFIKTYTNKDTININGMKYIKLTFTKKIAENYLMLEKNKETENYVEYYNALTSDIKLTGKNFLPRSIPESAVDVNLNTDVNLNKKTIVMFGDSITQDVDENDHYSFFVEKVTGSRSINQGYGGTSMSKHIDENFRQFSISRLFDAKLSNNFSKQEEVINRWKNGTSEESLRASNFEKQLNKLKEIDFNNAYAITLLYGANDHGYQLGTVDECNSEGITFCGAYNYAIKTIQEAFPHLGIVLITPIPRIFKDPNVENRTELFVNATIAIANKNRIPVYNAYTGLGFNEYNHAYFYMSDWLHPNFEKGQVRMGERISKFLSSTL